MVPTPLLISILLAATPLLWLGFHDARFPALGLGIMGGALLIAIADNLLSRRATILELTRQASDILSLGTPNHINIQVRSRCPRSLALIVKDDPPPAFRTPQREMKLRLVAFETGRVSYETAPGQRGDFHFGRLHVRVRSRLRLSWWQRSFPAEQQVRVYPDIQQVRKWEALARRGRLQDAGLRTRTRGEGTEFESLRDYMPDDSFRDIDWKATAKRGRPITRQFQTERNQSLIILLDSGRMMRAPVGDLTKLDMCINSALMLAHVAATMGDAVGMLTFSDRIKSFVPPGKGRQQTRRILEELYGLTAEMTEPDYRAAITYLRTHSRKRSLVVAFTDMVDTEVSAQVLAYLAALAPQHLPLVATVRDEEIVQLREQSPNEELQVYEKALAGRALEGRELALARLRQRGAYVCDARPDDFVAATVNQYLTIKQQGVL